jgi:adenine-specific DNA-methyltransferase
MPDEPNPIPPITRDDPAAQSGDVVGDNVAALKALFPSIVTDGKVDFDVLRQLLGDEVEEGDERYGLNWKGKARARAFALTPSLGTLRPAKDDSKDWDTTRNIVIEGDNLEVLKLLRKSYRSKVKAIYIDPPYNTGTNIVYPNKFEDSLSYYLAVTGQSADGMRLATNAETNGRFHTNWLDMIYPRLMLAKEMLAPDGVLFVTMDENEISGLILLLKEVFGEGLYEFANLAIVHNPRGQQGKNVSYVHENGIVVFRKDGNKYLSDVAKDQVDSRSLRDSGTESDRTDARNCFYPFIVKDGKILEIGQVPPNEFHPKSANVEREDGSVEIWPISETGDEKKWRYARDSVPAILEKLEPKMGRSSIQIIFHKDAGTMRSVWQNARFDSSEYGTKLLDSLIDGAGFTYPKSLWAVYDALSIMTADTPDATIMDFFAGSGTTGHAAMQLNSDKGGTRRFILVQIPEELDPAKKEQITAAKFCDKLGKPRTIAELTKERLRRAGEKVKGDNAHAVIDTGFRVYKLSTSNLKPWSPGDDLAADLLDAAGNILPGRSEADLLVELLLKTGIDLTLPAQTREITGCTVHMMGGGTLIVCLSDIPAAQARALGDGIADWLAESPPPAPTTFFFKDSGFDAVAGGTLGPRSAEARANLAATLRQRLGKDAIEKLGAI